jgi:hypothetical protein
MKTRKNNKRPRKQGRKTRSKKQKGGKNTGRIKQKGRGVGKSKQVEKTDSLPKKTRKNVQFDPNTKSPSSPKQNKTKHMFISKNKDRSKAVVQYENRQREQDLVDMILGKIPVEGGNKRKTIKSNKSFRMTRKKNYIGGTRSPQDLLNQIREGRQQIATDHQHVLQEEDSLASNSWASPDTSMNSSFGTTYSANSDDGETTHEDISFEEEEPADDDDPLNQGFVLEEGESL